MSAVYPSRSGGERRRVRRGASFTCSLQYWVPPVPPVPPGPSGSVTLIFVPVAGAGAARWNHTKAAIKTTARTTTAIAHPTALESFEAEGVVMTVSIIDRLLST